MHKRSRAQNSFFLHKKHNACTLKKRGLSLGGLVLFVTVTRKRNIVGHVQVLCVNAGGTYV